MAKKRSKIEVDEETRALVERFALVAGLTVAEAARRLILQKVEVRPGKWRTPKAPARPLPIPDDLINAPLLKKRGKPMSQVVSEERRKRP